MDGIKALNILIANAVCSSEKLICGDCPLWEEEKNGACREFSEDDVVEAVKTFCEDLEQVVFSKLENTTRRRKLGMNESLLKLIDLLKGLYGGKMDSFLEANLIAFADESLYDIKTIDDLIDAIETELSYYADN